MTIEPGTPITLQHRGDGPHLILVSLERPRLMRGRTEYGKVNGPFLAAKLIGAEFEGGADRDRSVYETNVYAPRDENVRQRDRPIITSLEFHHVQLLHATTNGRTTYAATLAYAQAYTAEELAAEATALEYLPDTYEPLEPYFGWRAEITVMPVKYANG